MLHLCLKQKNKFFAICYCQFFQYKMYPDIFTSKVKFVNTFIIFNISLYLHLNIFLPSSASWYWALTRTTSRPLTHLPRHPSLPWYWQKIDEPGRWVPVSFCHIFDKDPISQSLHCSFYLTLFGCFHLSLKMYSNSRAKNAKWTDGLKRLCHWVRTIKKNKVSVYFPLSL